jgi:DNA-directed RNA polymerase subunit M/transcription elongation factor TFIIS
MAVKKASTSKTTSKAAAKKAPVKAAAKAATKKAPSKAAATAKATSTTGRTKAGKVVKKAGLIQAGERRKSFWTGDGMTEVKCWNCGETKEVSKFNVQTAWEDGTHTRSAECRTCMRGRRGASS